MRARELKRKTWLNNRNVKIFDLNFVNFKHFQKVLLYSDQSVGGITLQYLCFFSAMNEELFPVMTHYAFHERIYSISLQGAVKT